MFESITWFKDMMFIQTTVYKKTNMVQENFSLVLNLQITDSVTSLMCECIVLYSFFFPHLAILLLTGVFMNLFDFM